MRLGKLAAALVLLAAFASTARADLDANEKKWLKQCFDALMSKSARVRDGGAVAIAKLGVEAIPALLPDVGRLKTDEDWKALASALTLFGAKDAADIVDLARDKWPKGQEQRLGSLVAQLRDSAKPAKPGEVDPELDAKIRELLEPFRTAHMYSSDEPAVRRVIAFGRPAVPTLVAMLRETGEEHGPGMLNNAITDALAALVDESDVPILKQLLEEGRLVATRAFARVRSSAVLGALLDTVDRGFVSYDLVTALEAYATDPRVPAALVAWLEAHGAGAGWELGPVAKFVGSHRVAAAVPALLKLAALRLESHAAVEVGIALAGLGRKEGIESLINVIEDTSPGSGGPSNAYERHEAGEALNRIAGRRIYSGSFDPGRPLQGNADDAAKQFRAWWTEVKDKIRFDEKRRAWVVD